MRRDLKYPRLVVLWITFSLKVSPTPAASFCGLRYGSHGHAFRIVLKRQCYGFDSTDPNISRLLKAQIKESYPETAFAIQSSLVPSERCSSDFLLASCDANLGVNLL